MRREHEILACRPGIVYDRRYQTPNAWGSESTEVEGTMSGNGQAKLLENISDSLCAACGLPANPDSDHVVKEVTKGWIPQDTVCLVWHRGCYDEFLDHGEES